MTFSFYYFFHCQSSTIWKAKAGYKANGGHYIQALFGWQTIKNINLHENIIIQITPAKHQVIEDTSAKKEEDTHPCYPPYLTFLH